MLSGSVLNPEAIERDEDPLNINIYEKRTSKIFKKILIEDQKLLQMLKNNAYLAAQAGCPGRNVAKLARGLSMEIPKDLKPIPGQYPQIIWTFKYNELKYIGWNNFRSIPTPYPNVQGALIDQRHFEIWLQGQENFSEIMKHFSLDPKFHDVNRFFTFTGFGRAGIMAVYAALKFAHTYNTIPTVITFGKPLMGNMKFAEFVESQIDHYRITYRDDFTPNVPPKAISHKKVVKYVPLESEYWIPFQDECECSSSESDETIKFPALYKCFTIGILEQHPQCNADWLIRRKKAHRYVKYPQNDDHYGPYFGHASKNRFYLFSPLTLHNAHFAFLTEHDARTMVLKINIAKSSIALKRGLGYGLNSNMWVENFIVACCMLPLS
ncbi:hypothetical protein G9A89_011513 [Geosiphon pyriformis]|nr:hypothetical protein G9A89_011513 [Geosiphon pyriformis]